MADVTDPLQNLRQKDDGAKQSTADACYEWIKRQIVTNARPPGSALDERNLADELNVSRTPVREAMLRLRSERFIENLPRRGAFVRALTLEDLSDLYDVVTAVEVMAVGLIAQADDRAQVVAELNRLCDRMEAALEDPELWTHSDEAFHRALLELSGNAPLAQTGLLHRDLAQRAHFVADRARPKGTENKSVETHRALVALIAEGDADAARANHLEQRQRGSESLIAAIRALGLRSL